MDLLIGSVCGVLGTLAVWGLHNFKANKRIDSEYMLQGDDTHDVRCRTCGYYRTYYWGQPKESPYKDDHLATR